ncbi:hypothetical protein [Streptomyces afghaniensis]
MEVLQRPLAGGGRSAGRLGHRAPDQLMVRKDPAAIDTYVAPEYHQH